MDFKTLFQKVSPKLKAIAKNQYFFSPLIDKDDLYQEMCIHLWVNFSDGLPSGINEAYVIQGCRFYLLNYIRKNYPHVRIISLEEPLNEDGCTLKDILPDRKEPLRKSLDRKLTIIDIKNNGFTKREKQVFLLLLDGYTTREVGARLGISHVRVIKLKQNLIKRWNRKVRRYQRR